MDINEIPTRSSDGNVNVFVEIPKDSQDKYEYDKDPGIIVSDRTLHYPTDYGFVPGTRGSPSAPLDAMVMVDESTFPGCLVEARIIGVLTIKSSNACPEQKLLGVPVREPRFAEYGDVSDVPGHLLREIEHFFDVFKDLEGSDIGVLGWEGAQEAQQLLDEAIHAGRRAKKSPPRLTPEPGPLWAARQRAALDGHSVGREVCGCLLGDHFEFQAPRVKPRVRVG